MKKRIMIVVVSIFSFGANAQTFREWFFQKSTQLKYSRENILLLVLQKGVVKEGYKIGDRGLTDIGGITKMDFDQHDAYFLSLFKAKDAVRADPRVAEAFKMGTAIEQRLLNIQKGGLESLQVSEMSYIKGVSANLLRGTKGLVQELRSVVEDGHLGMKDSERLERLEKIYRELLDRNQFAGVLERDVKLLVLLRKKEASEVRRLSKIHGLSK